MMDHFIVVSGFLVQTYGRAHWDYIWGFHLVLRDLTKEPEHA